MRYFGPFRFLSRALAAVMVATAPGLLRADDRTWAVLSGEYSDGSNWFGGVPPTVTDNVRFDWMQMPESLGALAVSNASAVDVAQVFVANGTTLDWTMGANVTASSLYLESATLNLTSNAGLVSWTAPSVFATDSTLSVGVDVAMTSTDLTMSHSGLNIAEGGSLTIVPNAGGDRFFAHFNSGSGDTTSTINGSLTTTGLGIADSFGNTGLSYVEFNGPGASLVDEGYQSTSTYLPTVIGVGSIGRASFLNGATGQFKDQVVLGQYAGGDGSITADDGSLTFEKDLTLGASGGTGLLQVNNGSLTAATIRLGDHLGGSSDLVLTNSTATADYIFIGGTDPFGTETSDHAGLSVTNSTLNAQMIDIQGHANDDYLARFDGSTLNISYVQVDGGTFQMNGGVLTTNENPPYVSGFQVNSSKQGSTLSKAEFNNAQVNLNGYGISVGDNNTETNGGMLFKATGSNISIIPTTGVSGGGLTISNFGGGVGDVRAEFTNSTVDANAGISVGESGNGNLVATGSQIQAKFIGVGRFDNGAGYVELHNSSLSAVNPTPPIFDDFVIGGTVGGGDVNLFGSSINGQKIHIKPTGILRGDGTVSGSPLGGTLTSVFNEGTISPGHSPGTLTIDGNLINHGTLLMEINLDNPLQYDVLNITGDFTAGGTLRLVALGSGVWNPSLTYNLLNIGGQFSGAFGSFDIDPKFTGLTSSAFTLNDGRFGINPQAVPEPASLAALGLGALALLRRRRRA